MLRRSKISLNRIVFPDRSLKEFFKFSSGVGLNKVELRNDLPGIGIIDAYTPKNVTELSEQFNIKILAINALQKFNLGAVLSDALEELSELIGLSISINCEAIVLVPNNDVNDKRGADTIFKETVTALKTFGPLFEDSGILGYVEPLGFGECSLRSKVTAIRAIQESGYANYKIVYDTFHHHLGPDTADTFENGDDISYIGVVHVSGLESDIPPHEYKDSHRILVTAKDRLNNLEQLEQLQKLGYDGDISFEPFAKELQTMEIEALKAAINESIDHILNQ